MRMQNRRKKSLVVSTDEAQLETGCQKQSKNEIKIQRPTAIGKDRLTLNLIETKLGSSFRLLFFSNH